MILPEWIEGGVGGGGGGGLLVESQSINFTAVHDRTYLTTGALLIQLPPTTNNTSITIKKKDDQIVTLLPHGLDKIEGVNANYQLTSIRESATLVSDGTDWFRI